MQTHTVSNQAQPLVDYDMFSSDAVLRDLVTEIAPPSERFGNSWRST